LLNILFKNKPNIVGYEVLEYSLAKDDYTSKEALRVAINSLRKKIGKESIKNHSKIGYSLCV
jgi:DNA-binding response OmpR family regulator